MLQDIRENSQGTIAKIIIGLLIVSLSIWGMDAIIGGFSGEPEVATVNGEDITEREFMRVVQIESQRQLSRMETPDQSLLNEDQIRKDVLESLIRQKVLTQNASEQGLALSDADIDALITQMPQFQVDGVFNRDRFVSSVRNMGMGVAEFRETMRKQYVINQIRTGVVQSGLVVDQNASHLLSIQNQTRDFRTLTLPASMVSDEVEVSEEEVASYYEENSDAFKLPEQVEASYIVLSLEALAETIDVSQEDLQSYYQERAADLAREERQASHILIEDGGDAEEVMKTIQQRLAEGESFSELAEEYSVDTISAEQGGDLGYAGRGVYDPAFEDALFALKEGEVSEPVATSFGLHLIKLTDVRKSEVPPLAELEEKLTRELARSRANERFAEVRTELADLAYAEDNLTVPAEELSLEVRTKEGVTRDGGEPPFDHAGLVRQLFSEDVLEDGYNTELIDVGDNMSVVARVSSYQEARQQPLENVASDIRDILTRQKTREALAQRAEEAVASLRSGEDASALGLGEWTNHADQARTGSSLNPVLMAEVFSLQRPQGETVYGSHLAGDSATIIALDEVNEGEVDADSQEYQQLTRFLSTISGQREYAAYQEYLRNRAEVERP
ncbi:SurA N-terminal domain-containing protein [Marinobacter sp. CHS3-4]|uniref:SurA N-terminal domain-containing protein n=1 Tax=Marinobacter sp. CHS3-4 TaxID=3045174 RepID=UPI0024B5CD1E|nr:SurA N-terminal domain-containing protein [Marinobacter sp. CHS3-4]MDI9245771.1 SurA N-terminal domain-containing protein [Marinobacter sp. CHS3-4]